jgi:hypothetical protein
VRVDCTRHGRLLTRVNITFMPRNKMDTAKEKVLAWMEAQAAKGIYPWAWDAPDWKEYQAEQRGNGQRLEDMPNLRAPHRHA